MEIVKKDSTMNTNATASNGGIAYVFNYSTQDIKLVSLSGQGYKDGVQLGYFNISDQENLMSNANFNFSSNASLTERQAIVTDITTIHDQLIAELTL